METSRILHFFRKKVKVAFHDFFFSRRNLKFCLSYFNIVEEKGNVRLPLRHVQRNLRDRESLPSNNIIDIQIEINPTSLPVQNGSFLHVKDNKHS